MHLCERLVEETSDHNYSFVTVYHPLCNNWIAVTVKRVFKICAVIS